jgi:aminopeptidase N
MRATIAGFHHPMQSQLVAPFTEQYFTIVPQIWHRRTTEIAHDIVQGLFPTWSSAITVDTVRMADRLLGDHSYPAPFRRLISEGRADVTRALTARACDTAAASGVVAAPD